MRKTLVLLALLASSALFLTTAPAASAAANCTNVYASTTWWDGMLNFGAYIGACTSDVSQVEFITATQQYAGWFDGNDQTGQPYKYSTTGYGPAVQNWAGVTLSVAYKRAPWCGGANHQVQPWFHFRIRNASQSWPGVWGPWKIKWGPVHNILC